MHNTHILLSRMARETLQLHSSNSLTYPGMMRATRRYFSAAAHLIDCALNAWEHAIKTRKRACPVIFFYFAGIID